MPEAYFTVARRYLHDKRWLEEKFTRGQAWLDLFGLAAHAPTFVRIRGIKIPLDRGQLAVSEVEFAKRWTWSRNKVRRFLSEQQTEQQIEQQKTNVTTVVTIVNYDEFQLGGTKTIQQTEHQAEQQTIQQKDTYKKIREEEKKSKRCVFAPPTLTELSEYATEKGWQDFNPQAFLDHYESNGWKVGKNGMKSWPHAVSKSYRDGWTRKKDRDLFGRPTEVAL